MELRFPLPMRAQFDFLIQIFIIIRFWGSVRTMRIKKRQEQHERLISWLPIFNLLDTRHRICVIFYAVFSAFHRFKKEIINVSCRALRFFFRRMLRLLFHKLICGKRNALLREHIVFSIDPYIISRLFHITKEIVFVGFDQIPQGAVPGRMRVLPGHKRTAARRTNRVLNVTLFEQSSFFRKTVQIWCFHKRMAITPNTFRAHFIRHK